MKELKNISEAVKRVMVFCPAIMSGIKMLLLHVHLVAEAAAWAKSRGMSLFELLA